MSRLLDVCFSFWVRFGEVGCRWIGGGKEGEAGSKGEELGMRERERGRGGEGNELSSRESGRSSTLRRLACRSERLRSTISLGTGFTHHPPFRGREELKRPSEEPC